MTPTEKAKELVDKFSVVGLQQRNEGIQCALIAVDEIIKSYPHSPSKPLELMPLFFAGKYWQEVKQEIEKL